MIKFKKYKNSKNKYTIKVERRYDFLSNLINHINKMSKEKVKLFFKDVFDIHDDKATNAEIKEGIMQGAKLKGKNMCILILAIIISCVGLNINSTEAIIGAMLISPMMGALIGMGYALSILDTKFFKRATAAVVIQFLIGVITSTIYFILTPLSSTTPALLGRVSPNIFSVIIAIAGGLAGGIGVTRKDKGNILTGVAIATSLIPPICTIGYGISILNFSYLFGALYLFFINAFFICISSMIVFNIMKMPKKKATNEKEIKKIKRDIIIISLITIIPSILLAYPVIKETMIEYNVKKYINSEFKFDNTQIVQTNIDTLNKTVELALIGDTLSNEEILEFTKKLSDYDLHGLTVKVTQTSIDENEVTKIIQTQVETSKDETISINKLKSSLKNNYDKIKEVTVTKNETVNDSASTITSTVVNITITSELTSEESSSINSEIKELLGDKTIINKVLDTSEE